MNEIFTWIKMLCGALCGLLTYVFGGADAIMFALIICVVVDYISGLMGAIVQGKVNSEVGYKGIIKKIGIFLIVALAHIIGQAVGICEIREIAIGFYIANEGISILENAGKMGVKYPKKLKDILEQLNSDNGGDDDGNQ